MSNNKMKEVCGILESCKKMLKELNNEDHYDENCRASFFLDEAILALERCQKDFLSREEERKAEEKAKQQQKVDA